MSPKLLLLAVSLPCKGHAVTTQCMCTHFSCLWSSPSSPLTPSYIVINISTFSIHIYYPAASWMMLTFSFSWQCLLYVLMNFHILIPNIYAMFAKEIKRPFPTLAASIPHFTPPYFPWPVSHSWVSPYFYHPTNCQHQLPHTPNT